MLIIYILYLKNWVFIQLGSLTKTILFVHVRNCNFNPNVLITKFFGIFTILENKEIIFKK